MAYGQADIDALKAAIGTGALRVRYADGREVFYRSLDDMERILGKMQADVTPPSDCSTRSFVIGF